MKNRYIYGVIIFGLVLNTGCKKYLDSIPDKSESVPQTLVDFRQILDYGILYNQNSPGLHEFAGDDVTIPDGQFSSTNIIARNSYIWADNHYNGQSIGDWQFPYLAIYYANVVLDALKSFNMNENNMLDYNAIKGTALYYRGFNHYCLTQVFAKPFSTGTASRDLGIPYKENSLIDEKVKRGTLAETYAKIFADLKSSVSLLPKEVTDRNKNRPTKASVYAVLARIYLSMSDYSHAKMYADSCLNTYNTLINYNDIIPGTFAFKGPPTYNAEVLCLSSTSFYLNFIPVSSELYNLYDIDDLRKTYFFRPNVRFGSHEFRGSYLTGVYPFNGPATDEVYLIRAECLARSGNKQGSLDDLNALLINRYKTGSYHPYTVDQVSDILGLVLTERRKELVFRGLRWSDLRRFNLEGGAYAKDITHTVNGVTYTLKKNDPKYVFPIPDAEITLSGIEQN
ncbi:SusD family protein [bacterium A37T11]|nr:SusD family protein [bacterium A37T11]